MGSEGAYPDLAVTRCHVRVAMGVRGRSSAED